MPASLEESIHVHHLRWLDHVSRTHDSRLPAHLLFPEGANTWPRQGPNCLWRDVVALDLRATGMSVMQSCHLVQDRRECCELSCERPPSQQQPRVFVCIFGRGFHCQKCSVVNLIGRTVALLATPHHNKKTRANWERAFSLT